MMGNSVKGQRLVALFLLGWLLLNYPLLDLAAGDMLIFGIPLIYAYLFFVWATLIVLMTLVVERGPD
jgi:hypothetical protein